MSDIRHIDKHYAATRFGGLDQWNSYRRWLRRAMKVSLSLAPAPVKGPLKAKVFGKKELGPREFYGYTCEKVCFESLPGFYVTGNLFRPDEKSRKKRPAILCPHGHWPDGRLHDRDVIGSIILRCIQLARMGAVVFSYDMVGYNDSCQVNHHAMGHDPHYGLSTMALQTWNSIRAIDFLESLPDVNPRRIGITGCSGGGTQTFTLCGVDDRMVAAAPICMISYHMQGGCVCENAPLLRIGATSVDIARLFAPKPMFMGSCTGDWTKYTEKEELPAMKQIYGLYGARSRLMHHQVDAEHNYNQELREHVYGFFNKYLLGGTSARPIKEARDEPVRPVHVDRMVWWGREAPGPITAAQMRQLWRQRVDKALKPHLKSAEAVRKGLGDLLAPAVGMTLDSVAEFRAKRPATITIKADGKVLVVRAKTPKGREKIEKYTHWEGYNRTVFAERVHEIMAAVENAGGRVELNGIGKAGPACLVAAALSKKVREVKAEMGGFDPERDRDWAKYMDTPSIRQIGGLATVFALIGKRPVELKHATAGVKRLMQKYCR